MEFNCEVKIVDACMGSGKSSAAINYMNNPFTSEKFLYITPLLDEMKRIVAGCPNKNFVTPEPRWQTDSKLTDIKRLVKQGKNIASTHALFHYYDQEMIDLCRANNYTLVMDEVTDVIHEYPLSKEDFKILLDTCVYVDPETHLIKWREDASTYSGKKFEKEKKLCDMNCLAYYGDSVMMWLFPIDVFNAFRKVYILTYLFDAQLQKYYYDFFKLPYSYTYISGDSPATYQFSDTPTDVKTKYNYADLIHVETHEKLNMIGDLPGDLSVTWFQRNKTNGVLTKLKNNILNYFTHIVKAKSNDIIWTTFKDYKNQLKGKGYTNGFLSVTTRSTNNYQDRHYVAYIANRFLNPYIKKFFEQNDITVNEDLYALSEMLQFIWRSAIRNGEQIWIYVPSVRMRKLLQQWIEENSIEEGGTAA